MEIATKLGARVVEASWHGYAAQKNIATELATHDWILALDADESLSEALEAEIWHIKKSGPQFDGYTMPRLAQYLGRWILHSGWYPDRKVRLFDRRKAKWVGEFVHESVKVYGACRASQIKSVALSPATRLSQHLRSMDSYTTLAAQELVSNHKVITVRLLLFEPPWTFLQDLFPSTRVPRWGRRPHDRIHGGPLQFPEIFQGASHEPRASRVIRAYFAY